MNKYMVIYNGTSTEDISHEVIFADDYIDCLNRCIKKGYPLQRDIKSITKLNDK